jgi:lipopolysaccharide/colanic/teichoic acid biosynthesis glycosyltransferase
MNRAFRAYMPPGLVGLVFSEAILLCFAYTLAAFASLSVDPEVVLLDIGGWKGLTVVLLAVLISMHLQDLYSEVYVQSWVGLLEQLCAGFGFALVVEAGITYVHPALRVPVRVMVVGSATAMALVVLWRMLYTFYVLSVVGKQRVLFVGTNPLVDEIVKCIEQHQELGLAVVGYVGDPVDGDSAEAGKNLGPMHRISEIAVATRPDRIVVGLAERREKMPVADLLQLRLSGYLIEEAPATYEMVYGRVSTKGLRPSQLILSSEFAPRNASLFYQSLFNFGFALAGILVTAPVMLLAALAVRLNTPGPVLHREQRLGRAGAVFTHYSFRLFPEPGSEEMTRVGKVLWRLGLAELPALWNVLRGEMSIVGPHAESRDIAVAAQREIPFYRHRQTVRPGMTGWAQIHAMGLRHPLDLRQKLEYDLYYIRHLSFGLDAFILIATLKRVLQGRVS